jgi:Macrocin-O-methyltransferase (TylF)
MTSQSPFRRATDSSVRMGRNISHGYARGWGLQFSDLREQVRQDPLYREAMALAKRRTIVAEDNRMNVFLIMKYFLSNVPFGHIVEFGSYKGGQAIFMSHVAKRVLPGVKVYAFDTFRGMPATDSSIDAHNAGDFSDVDIDELRAFCREHELDNLELVQGLFEDTAPALLPRIESVSLAHIDCDIKSACVFSYDVVKPYMVTGGYYVFDDATTSSCLGATEAVEEVLIQRDHLYSEQIFPHFVFRHNLQK